MNGIHDCGGMDGLGPIIQGDEGSIPPFAHEWEGRVFALSWALSAGSGLWNLDEARFAIERMPAAEYLSSTYYEHWLYYIELLIAEKNILPIGAVERRYAELVGRKVEVNR